MNIIEDILKNAADKAEENSAGFENCRKIRQALKTAAKIKKASMSAKYAERENSSALGGD